MREAQIREDRVRDDDSTSYGGSCESSKGHPAPTSQHCHPKDICRLEKGTAQIISTYVPGCLVLALVEYFFYDATNILLTNKQFSASAQVFQILANARVLWVDPHSKLKFS